MRTTPATRRSSLVDHLGRPIDFTVLQEEISAPSTTGVRNPVGGHPAHGLTPERLAAVLRAAEADDPRAYYELAEDMEEKDLHYLGVLGTRKRQVTQLEITVDAATDDQEDQDNAQLIRDWLDRDTLQEDLFDVMDAVGKGHSLTELVWNTDGAQWWIERLEWVDPRHQRFSDDGRDVQVLDEAGLPQPLKPFKYLLLRIKAKSGLTVRGGLARAVAWGWMFKNYAVKDWVAFAEVYGLPFRVGKYEPGATAADKRTLLRAVADISTDAAAIISKSMDIEFITAGGSADGAVFSGMADWFDRQTSKGVLGQTGTTDMQSGAFGGGGQSQVHDGVRADIEQADAKALAAALNRDLVRPMVDLNKGPPRSGKYPRIRIGRAEGWDAVTMMPAVEKFVGMGGRVGQSFIRDRLGIEDPGKDEELLKAPSAAPPPGSGETPPGAPKAAPGAPTVAERPLAASLAFSGLLNLISAATRGGSGAPPEPDPIERFIASQVSDWKPLMAPVTAPLQQLVEDAGSLDEIRDGILALVEDMDVAQLGELLARAGFNARLAGAAGAELAQAEN